jgi:hypothetical protein
MSCQGEMDWLLSLLRFLRRSQAKTLSQLALATSEVVRASLAELGRALASRTGGMAKHCIKRVDRFIGNPRIEPVEAMRGVVGYLARPRRRLVVSLDWVDIRQFWCLVLAARLKGRAVPLVWAVYHPEAFFRSRNAVEEGLLRALRTMVPAATAVLILADRGFGRAEMARLCQALGFEYLIRIHPNVFVHSPTFTGLLTRLPVRPGRRLLLRDVLYRRRDPVRQHVAVVWKAGRTEPWFLMTNLRHVKTSYLARLYALRMTIEEYFRDAKSLRNGFALRLTLIRDPERLSRMLLVLALAYLVLLAVGLYAQGHGQPRQWCSNNRPGECSLFTIGRFMIRHGLPPPRSLLRLLKNELLAGGNWG